MLFAQNGGFLISGVGFRTFARWPGITDMFRAFSVPWQSAAYTKVNLSLNKSAEMLGEKNL